MALDYLPIQASAVPSERVFSSGKETMTPRRNRTKPELMEALQITKFSLKKDRLNFTKGWEAEARTVDEASDTDLLERVIDAPETHETFQQVLMTLAADE